MVESIPLTVREEPRDVLMFPRVAWRTARRQHARRVHLRPGLRLEAGLLQLAEWQSPVAKFQGLQTHNSITRLSLTHGSESPRYCVK
jgi:hypothetical protein